MSARTTTALSTMSIDPDHPAPSGYNLIDNTQQAVDRLGGKDTEAQQVAKPCIGTMAGSAKCGTVRSTSLPRRAVLRMCRGRMATWRFSRARARAATPSRYRRRLQRRTSRKCSFLAELIRSPDLKHIIAAHKRIHRRGRRNHGDDQCTDRRPRLPPSGFGGSGLLSLSNSGNDYSNATTRGRRHA